MMSAIAKRRHGGRRGAPLIVCAVVSLGVLSPFLFHIFFIPIQFNQFLIGRLEFQYGTISISDLFGNLRSAYFSGLDVIRGRGLGVPPPFNDPKGFFSYLFSWIPPYATVYPTERFYYFSTELPGTGEVRGNIRIADADKGKISLAYFKTANKETRLLDITEKDGLMVNRISDYIWDITWHGKTVHFRIPETDLTPPQKLRMLPQEEFAGHIHDESGIKFFLLFNQTTNSFYSVLDDENGVADRFTRLDGWHTIGQRTGFIFYEEPNYGRRILVGAHLENVAANNYFDGPGDQVPIRVNLRDRLHKAYPNTMLGDGVDEYGVYLNKPEWVRIAVSPFHRYASYAEVSERGEKCEKQGSEDKAVFWTCLTKEWWNTPAWRNGIYDQLEKEGKKVERIL